MRVLRPLPIRGKARVLGKFLPWKGERVANIFGCRMRLDLADHGQRWIYIGNFEREETRWAKKWLSPGMTFVDVGANVGYYTLLASSCVGPKGKVFAVEPSPYAYTRLCRTVADNGLTNVVTLQAALGSAAGEGLLYPPPFDIQSQSMVPGDNGGVGETVRVKTLDECLDEWGSDRVDLLKMDVEGYEPQVLAGAQAALRSGKIRAMLCEFNDVWLRRAGGSAEDLYHLIESAGFSNPYTRPSLHRDCLESCFFVHAKA